MKIKLSKKLIIIFTFLSVLLLIPCIYWPVFNHQFLYWDDYPYIYKNPYINYFDIEFIRWALTTTYFSYWHPITWISHGADYALWGMDSGMHHLTNLILYGIESLCVFFLSVSILKISWNPAGTSSESRSNQYYIAGFITTLLFIVHPQHVEVVAWVSERKELLSTIFILLTLLAYLQYYITNVFGWLLISFLFFIFALMSKPMAVTVPALLITLDIYPLNRINKNNYFKILFLEKLPFVVLSVVIIIITIIAQKDAGALQDISILSRLINTCNNSLLYLFNLIWPLNISIFYPFPSYVKTISLISFIPPVVFTLLTLFCIVQFKAGKKYWLCVWLVYLISLSPVSGIIHSGPQAAADRYAHLTTIGFYILFGLYITKLLDQVNIKWRFAISLALPVVIFSFAYLSHTHVKLWKDDFSIWQSVIQKYPLRSSLAHNNLGNAYLIKGDYKQAKIQYFDAIKTDPDHLSSYDNLFFIFQQKQQWDEAIEEFELLEQHYPDKAIIKQILGDIYLHQGTLDIAEKYYQQAVNVDPDFVLSNYRLAQIYLNDNSPQEAILELQKAINILPTYVDAMLLLANIYRAHGNELDALTLYWKSYHLSPYYKPAYDNLIISLESTNQANLAEEIRKKTDRLRKIEIN